MKIALPLLLVALLTACSSGPDLEYLGASSSANLEVPPDLTGPELNEKFVLPENFSSGTGETVKKIPVLAQVESLRLEGSADFYWLAVDGPVENLYQLIRNFWASEGYNLIVDEPVIGVMQTRWVLKEEGYGKEDPGFLDRLLGFFKDRAASQDQFRTRIEKDQGTASTRIYITHRGIELKYQDIKNDNDADGIDGGDWVFRPREAELEVEMLSRLMIYLGLNQASVDQQLAGIKLFAPRATIHGGSSESETYLLVKSIKELTWNRLLHELDRLSIEVTSSNLGKGLLEDTTITVKTEDKVEEKTGFFNTETKLVPKEIVIVVSEETDEITRVSIEKPDGDIDESTEGIEFLTKLYEQIK